MESQANARFKLENARVIRVKELAKVAFLRVLCYAGKFPQQFEVVCFQPAPFPLEEGMAVSVSGEVQKRKPQDPTQKEWPIELIARRFEKGDTEKAPPMPAVKERSVSRQRDEQPSDFDF
jgi:hypothetical protein